MKVITTGTATFSPPCVLGLNKAQHAARAYALEKVKGGYEVIKPVQFKAGETITLEGDIPKGMESVLEPADKSEAESKAKAEAEAKEAARQAALADLQSKLEAADEAGKSAIQAEIDKLKAEA